MIISINIKVVVKLAVIWEMRMAMTSAAAAVVVGAPLPQS